MNATVKVEVAVMTVATNLREMLVSAVSVMHKVTKFIVTSTLAVVSQLRNGACSQSSITPDFT